MATEEMLYHESRRPEVTAGDLEALARGVRTGKIKVLMESLSSDGDDAEYGGATRTYHLTFRTEA